ncbi:MAG: hypothetical protein RDU14_17255 [Melioribacteraceae bacterium]|jgi:SRSO17 transposase|nr:hypothetical protein [Melioribacteraceae bacterium]
MIEIRITVEAALALLLERMKFELKFRQKAGIISKGSRMEDLSYKQLLEVAEASIFDTIFLLPSDLIVQESNLSFIITEAVKSLARIYKKEKFQSFSNKKAKSLLQPIIDYFSSLPEEKEFRNN